LTGCTKDHADKYVPPVNGCIYCLPTSFKTELIPIFTGNCGLTGCHGPPSGHNGLILDSASAYRTITKYGREYIDTADAAQSLLYRVLQPGSEHMPPGKQLDSCIAHTIFCWVKEGAPNN